MILVVLVRFLLLLLVIAIICHFLVKKLNWIKKVEDKHDKVSDGIDVINSDSEFYEDIRLPKDLVKELKKAKKELNKKMEDLKDE